MSSKERTHSKDSGTLKQTPSKPAVKDNAVAQPQTGPEQIRQNYGAVAQQNILQLQRTFGNRAVTELLTRAPKQPTQHQVEAHQASRRNVASTDGLVNRPVIQRTIKIEDDQGAEVHQLKTPADVKGYLEKNGIHFYYQYVKAAEMTDEIYEKKVTTYREPDAPQQLVTLLQQYQPGTGDINALGEGAQDFIQKKMLEIYELVRRHSVASLNLDKDSNEEYVDKTPQWYEMLGINGLCGGWVTIHQRHPEWIEDLWNAVESWHPPHGKSTAETLRLLNDHLGANLSWAKSGQGALEVEALLRNAVEFMSKLEPTEGYSHAPTSDPKTTDLSTAPLPTVLTGPDKITVSHSSAGQTVVQHIQLAINSQPDIHCIAHVETEAHHMSVRVKRDKTTLLLKVVETEKEGIRTCQSWDEVATILEGGIYLDPGDKADQDVEVTIYQK